MSKLAQTSRLQSLQQALVRNGPLSAQRVSSIERVLADSGVSREQARPLLEATLGRHYQHASSSLEELGDFRKRFTLEVGADDTTKRSQLRSIFLGAPTLRDGLVRRAKFLLTSSCTETVQARFRALERAEHESSTLLNRYLSSTNPWRRGALYFRLGRLVFASTGAHVSDSTGKREHHLWEYPLKTLGEHEHAAVRQRLTDHYSEARNRLLARQAEHMREYESLSAQYPQIQHELQVYDGSVFTRFLRWYTKMQLDAPYRTGVATATFNFSVGNAIGQLMRTGEVDPIQPLWWGLVCLYYGWEIPALFYLEDRDIPQTKGHVEDDAWQFMRSARQLVHGPNRHSAILAMGGAASAIIQKRRGELKRVLVDNFLLKPFWGIRHGAITAAINTIVQSTGGKALPVSDTAAQITSGALKAFAYVTLPSSLPKDYVLQNKIPLEYRFLALSAYNVFIWQPAMTLFLYA